MSSIAPAAVQGVLLMTFGSAVTSADVPDYLRSVRGGREPSAELVDEFRRRFDVIGRSPLIDITLEQARKLEAALDVREPTTRWTVEAGMLHSAPRVRDALERLAERGATDVIAVVLAPQYSPLILSGYERTVAACAAADQMLPPVHVAGAWHLVPSWVTSLADRVRASLQTHGDAAPAIVFTAHSLPRPVVERDPQYMEQIHATIDAVAAAADLEPGSWSFAFQSAGHTPEEWLRPDLTEVLARLAHDGTREVLVVPVQFVADHLEILYDIDVAAAGQARAAGLRFHRIEMPNAGSRFIDALVEVVDRERVAAATL